MGRNITGPEEVLMSRKTASWRVNPLGGRRAGAAATAVLSLSLVLGGCGIGKVINAVHALADAAGSLKNLQSEIQKGEKASYEATYATTGSGGSSSPITFAQEPGGKYAFMQNATSGSGGTDFVADGKNQYECSQVSGSKWSCVQSAEPSGTGSFAGDPFFAFTGAYVYGIVEALRVEAAIEGFKVTNSTTTVNGISLKCVAISGKANGQTEDYKWCITSDGILGLVKSTGSSAGDNSSFEITKLDTSPPASIFEPPSGASLTTVTT
jgi:hypothetical protein